MTADGQPEYVNAPPARSRRSAEPSAEQQREEEPKQRSIGDVMREAYHSNNVAPLVVYTGDAAATLDPTLAQVRSVN